jgi:hypothetical protein
MPVGSRKLGTVSWAWQASCASRSVNQTNRRLVSAAVFCAAALFGCSPNHASKQAAGPETTDEESRLLAEPSSAVPELSRRLRAAISARDGLIVVENPLLGLTITVLPATAPWSVKCGPFLSVHFGNVAAERDDHMFDETSVFLSIAGVSKETCMQLAPAIGKEVLAILSEAK